MAAPIADETLNEWVELYNDASETIDVSGFIIGDDFGNDTIEGGFYNGLGTIMPPYGYAILTAKATRAYNNFNCSPDAIKLYVDDSSIGNGLKNSGETLYLYDNNKNLIYAVEYNETDEGKGFAFLNNSWYESYPTPGYNNNGSITATAPNYGSNNCDWKIEVLVNKTIFENKDEFEFKMRASKIEGDSTNLTGEVNIYDLSGNEIKEYKPWANEHSTNQKTSTKYSPSLEEGKSYMITANLEVQCDDTNPNNNINQKIITIKGTPQTTSPQQPSSISIDKIYDLGKENRAKFGQMVSVGLIIYKGDTAKSAITALIEKGKDKISKQSKINVEKKFTEYKLTIPIQLKPNCDHEYDDGKYKVNVEGLDTSAEAEIKVEDINDDLCQTETADKDSSDSGFYFELVNWPLEIKNNQEFEIKLRLTNNDKSAHEADIWSYIYRGSKSYSGEREGNLNHLNMGSRSSKEFNLKNIIREAEAGEYNLMVQFVKDNQKTPQKITEKIQVVKGEDEEQKVEVTEKEKTEKKEEKIELKEKSNEDYSTILESKKQPKIIYESSTIKSSKLAIWFFMALLIIYATILTWRRQKP